MKPDFPLSLSIQYADQRLQTVASRPQIRRWVRAALQQPAAIALRFVGEAEGRALNRDFRKKDYATNVLTFAYGHASPDPENEAAAEADIILCADVILAEAKAQGKTPAAHLAHLIIHGVLHAQGYDHETENEAVEMEALETRILARFRIPDPYA